MSYPMIPKAYHVDVRGWVHGWPGFTIRNRPTIDPFVPAVREPQMKLKLIPMTEDDRNEIRRRTGSTPFLEQKYVRA